MEQQAKSTSLWKIILIILAILVILFGLYLGIAWILRGIEGKTTTSVTPSATAANQKTSSKKIDANLVGNWDTGCLVPDPDSPWAERHTFSIQSDGTANHKRYSGNSCAAIAVDHDDNIKMTIPLAGKIDLSYTSGIASGTTIYDIYQASGNTLEFGHGFRGDHLAYDGKTGSSDSDRFVTLNSFLAYKK